MDEQKEFPGPIVDSDMTLEEALDSPHESEPPREVIENLVLVDVDYFSFDGLLHRGQIVVHKDLAQDTKDAFELIRVIKFPVHSAIPIGDVRFLNNDEQSMALNNTSSFCYRNVAKLSNISNHSFGRAIDINPGINPYIRPDYHFPPDVEYDPSVPGAIVKDSPLYDFFISRGWEWGGDWTDRKDYMHFQRPQV